MESRSRLTLKRHACVLVALNLTRLTLPHAEAPQKSEVCVAKIELQKERTPEELCQFLLTTPTSTTTRRNLLLRKPNLADATAQKKKMEEAFKNLQKANHNSVDNLIKWMKDSKIVDGKKVTEEKARQLFADVTDASNVQLAKFQEVVGKLAEEHKKPLGEISKMLATEGPRFMNAAIAAGKAAAVAATSAFKDAFL